LTSVGKAAVNRTHSKRFARFQTQGKRGSAWSARALAPLSSVVAHREYQWLHECGKAFHDHTRAKAAEDSRNPGLLREVWSLWPRAGVWSVVLAVF
jgi:hypothetical protein